MSQVADLTAQAVDLIAAQLADARRPAITSSFQSECVVLTDLLRQVRRTSRCCSSTPSITFRRRSPIATR